MKSSGARGPPAAAQLGHQAAAAAAAAAAHRRDGGGRAGRQAPDRPPPSLGGGALRELLSSSVEIVVEAGRALREAIQAEAVSAWPSAPELEGRRTPMSAADGCLKFCPPT